jgi:hypothetical protein
MQMVYIKKMISCFNTKKTPSIVGLIDFSIPKPTTLGNLLIKANHIIPIYIRVNKVAECKK